MAQQTVFSKALICLVLVCLVCRAHAKSLDEEQARQAVAAFFSPSAAGARLEAMGRQLVLRSQGHERGYYVFDRPEGGCVFVADDDAIGLTILGYSEQGSYDAENLPTGLCDWLEQVEVLMNAVHEGKINREYVPSRARDVMVDALIKTTWNQNYPYNMMCPVVNGKNCVTGCVATAMAQVMKYWEWPVHGYGSVTYKDDGCGQTLSQDFSENYYNWKNMLNSYSEKGYTSSQANAVATLMRDCGYAVQMHYTTTESAAGVSARTMQNYFHYSAMAKDRYSGDYPSEMWHEYIRQDLRDRRPVLYSGRGDNGHEFILDGYDANGYYHVNWGWGGYQDGWFTLTNLNGYNDKQWMINRLEPDYNEDDDFSYTLSADSVLTINGTGMMPKKYALDSAPWAKDCESVRKIVFGKGITGIVEYFGYDNNTNKYFNYLKEVELPEGLLLIGSESFSFSKLSDVRLPSTLLNMDYAFYGCSDLKVLHLPENLEGYRDYLPGTEELSVDERNSFLTAEDNILYSKNRNSLLLIPLGLSRITIAETTERILDYTMFYCNIPILSKCMTAPSLPRDVTENPSDYVSTYGYLFIPNGATGYNRWEKLLPSGWTVMTYSDLDYVPETKITWSLDDTGILTLSGWGMMRYQEYAYENSPYYKVRSNIRKLVVREGVKSLCWDAYYGYSKMKEAELPSTLSYIDGYCFGHTALNSITCQAKTAPKLGELAFYGLPSSGTLRVPEGSDYSVWLKALPSEWKIEYFTPEPLAKCYLYTGEEQQVKNLEEWEKLLEEYPNTIGIVNPSKVDWAYMTHNMLIEDASSEGGYRCPYFQLTDLTDGYYSSGRTPQTGFSPPVSFAVMKGHYRRYLQTGYNTVCLPFTVCEDSLSVVSRMYTYSHFDTDKGDVIFSPRGVTPPGRACIIISDEDNDWQADLAGQTISTLQPSDMDDNMRGTFITTDAYQGKGYAPRSKDNVFAPLGQYLHPFRACLFVNAPGAPSEVRIRLSDRDGVTGISWGNVGSSKPADMIFTLDGKRLSSPMQGQPYIKNGKKVFVR